MAEELDNFVDLIRGAFRQLSGDTLNTVHFVVDSTSGVLGGFLFGLLSLDHVFLKDLQDGLGAVGKLALHQNVACEGGIAVGQGAEVELHAVGGVFLVVP